MRFDRHPEDAQTPRRATRRVRLALAAAGVLATAVLAGCGSSPPSHFYTLNPGEASAPAVANPPWLIELAPVDMPSQVAKNQLVVQQSATQVDVLEQERWASLPGDEVRRALSGDLTQQLGTIDVYGTPHPDGMPVYRISVNVQRFESWPGSHALIDAVWSVRSLRTQRVMTCRSVVSEPVGSGYEQLVAGHRRAVEALSVAIGAGVRALAQATPAKTGAHAAGASTAAGTASATVAVPCPMVAPSAAAAAGG
jgi:uncharacterized lipoprotein YmbA